MEVFEIFLNQTYYAYYWGISSNQRLFHFCGSRSNKIDFLLEALWPYLPNIHIRTLSRKSQANVHSIPRAPYLDGSGRYFLKWFSHVSRGSRQFNHPCEDHVCFMEKFVWWPHSASLTSLQKGPFPYVRETNLWPSCYAKMVFPYGSWTDSYTTLVLEVLSIEVRFLSREARLLLNEV